MEAVLCISREVSSREMLSCKDQGVKQGSSNVDPAGFCLKLLIHTLVASIYGSF